MISDIVTFWEIITLMENWLRFYSLGSKWFGSQAQISFGRRGLLNYVSMARGSEVGSVGGCRVWRLHEADR